MRNLLLFIARFHLFFIFVLLQTVSFSLYIRQNHFQKAIFFNTSNQITGSFYQGVSDVEEYFALRGINDKLQEENARLRGILKESEYIDTAAFTLKQDSSLRQKYTYIPADVVRNTVNLKNNFLTLNIGSNHGVHEEMGVISSKGVVGIVHKVSPNFCTVISLLNSNIRIAPKIDSVLNQGSLVWDGRSPQYAILEDVNAYFRIKENMEVVTSNLSSVFPENIPIGVIEELYVPSGEDFFKIKVKLHTNFDNLHKVYVVENLLKPEQDLLEQSTSGGNN